MFILYEICGLVYLESLVVQFSDMHDINCHIFFYSCTGTYIGCQLSLDMLLILFVLNYDSAATVSGVVP